MKKIFILIFILILHSTNVYAIKFNNNKTDLSFLKNKNMIHIKIVEYFGANLTWYNNTKSAVIKYCNNSYIIPINSYTIYKNGNRNKFNYKTKIINGKLYIHTSVLDRFFDLNLINDNFEMDYTRFAKMATCKIRVNLKIGTPRQGSAFWISPNKLRTAKHVIDWKLTESIDLISWSGYVIEKNITKFDYNENEDIGYIYSNKHNNYYYKRGTIISKNLYTFGYPHRTFSPQEVFYNKLVFMDTSKIILTNRGKNLGGASGGVLVNYKNEWLGNISGYDINNQLMTAIN